MNSRDIARIGRLKGWTLTLRLYGLENSWREWKQIGVRHLGDYRNALDIGRLSLVLENYTKAINATNNNSGEK